ncbi:hypothetical protein D9619_011014 [Psilocybe cf. subviscida]|uniref:Nephrocystin 3-like N-terminal domain-containing protein n=1 Tax=Psilocybe cf. subviscida TaxID=2480587 RepID=A0A8H5EZZ3_9AGAR|nr:hypothetical protein D9619_011014 [Psilocybe cf. subviscida]
MASHMFTGASIGTISNSTFVVHAHLEKSAFDRLEVAVAHSALHDAPARTDESRCHQHTRVNVLDNLERWAQGLCDEGAAIFWLHGGAGAGKSAIMQTLAERCVAQKLALGCFFFSRSDPTRNTAETLIPTLLYQLAQLFPSVLKALDSTINRGSVKKSFQAQLCSLFVPALQHLVRLGSISASPQSPRVFLIDGLDECGDLAQQQAIIQAVARVCNEHHLPVKFLVASRPEQAISTSFRWYQEENCVLGIISLSEDPGAKDDIRRFIKDEFLKIRLRHPFKTMIPSEWPNLYEINRLVWRSSSHFIYASTALRYIWSPKESPVRSLQVVLGLEVSRTISPFSDLDVLYRHILGPTCIMLDCSHNDLHIFMADMTPLVTLSKSGPYKMQEEVVKILHTSFRDFLLDQSRSGSLHIDKAAYLASKLKRCFQLLDLYSQKQCTTPNWPTRPAALFRPPYLSLTDQIIITIKRAGHIVATQEFLYRHGLSALYQFELRFNDVYQKMSTVIDHLVRFVIAVHSVKTFDSSRLFRTSLDDFFDILDSYLANEINALAPAILPSIFLGIPPHVVREILSYHCRDSPSYQLVTTTWYNQSQQRVSVLDLVTTEDLASIRHSANGSPKRLAVAAEAILEYIVIGGVQLYRSSTHKSWLQRTKPGKLIATGTPKLASVLHTECVKSLGLQEDKSLSIVLRPNYHFSRDELERQCKTLRLVFNLLGVLLWLLPKAGFSERILVYSRRTFPQYVYQFEPGLARRARRCLDEYAARVQNAKLEELGQRIENGDANALIAKSRMFYLDAQD